MRWEDERYVRIFTRDTPAWDAMGWEAQALLMLIFRKMDRTGLLALGSAGKRGLAAFVRMPIDVVERSLQVLLDDGVLSMVGPDIFCKNFLEAQECAKSDSLRSKEKRERAHLKLTQSVLPVTQSVAHPPRSDTTAPHGDTCAPRHDTPSVPSVPSDPISLRAREGELGASAHDWLSFFASRWWEARGRQYGQGEADARAAARMGEVLATLPATERTADWEARGRMVEEFLSRSDKATREAGWSFAFFVAGFNGLRIPESERPSDGRKREEPKTWKVMER